MKSIKMLMIPVILLLFSGCAKIYVLNMPLNEGMENYRTSEAYNDGRIEPDKDKIDIQLVCPDICGCLIQIVEDETEKKEKGLGQCLGIPLDSENAKETMIQKKEEAEVKNKSVYFFTYFNEVTREILAKSLESHYREVNITLSNNIEDFDELNNETIMDYYFAFFRTGRKNIFVAMEAFDEQGNKLFDITGNSENEIGNGHLGWILPVSIITFPIGTTVMAIILENWEKDFILKTAVEAIDDASRQFAEKSIEFADNGLTNINLLVRIE